MPIGNGQRLYSSGRLTGVGGGCTWIEKLWLTTRGFLSRSNIRAFPELVLMSFCLLDSSVCSVGFAVAHCVTAAVWRCMEGGGVGRGASLVGQLWASICLGLYFCLKVPDLFEV